jgi:ferric-dicitrate binding protein FerR (iron transport regulator)
MNACTKTQALLFESADGRVAATVRAELETHLTICPHCKQAFAAWTSALPSLRGLPLDEPSAVELRRMENEVLRQMQGRAAPPARRRLWLALAACLALAAGAGALFLRAPVPQPFARIQSMWGQVSLSGVAIDQGADVKPGVVVDLASEGEAAFIVGRAAEVRLFGPGRVAFAGTAQSPRLRLEHGRLAVQIEHRQPGESFVVATPHGHVDVRGTRFVVGSTTQGSYVHVDEGEVAAFRVGVAVPFPVKAGDTFSFKVESAPEPEAAPIEAPKAASELHPCVKSECAEAVARARKAMRAGNAGRAVELADDALGRSRDCALGLRCLDELGYLRAEALRQGGRLDAAVTAYQSLNRPGATRAMRQNALYAAAQIERKLGHVADARQGFEHAYAANPDGALAEEALAALIELGQPTSAEARAAAERYLAHYPQGMAAARARRILSR